MHRPARRQQMRFPFEMATYALTSSAVDELGEVFDQRSRAVFTAAIVVKAIEEGALFGEHEQRALAGGFELDGCERDGDLPLVEMHVVAIDDARIRHDVEIDAMEVRGHAAIRRGR